MDFVLAPKAIGDLEDIENYTAKNWGPDQATVYVEALLSRCATLAFDRKHWRSRDDLASGLFARREQQHVIIFRQQADLMEVARILHVRMDPIRHLD